MSIGVADLARSRRFYEEGLGLTPRPESHERAVFYQLEWSWLSLFERERLASFANVPSEGSGFPGFTFSHNVATPEEVDTVLAQAKAAGGTIPQPAEESSFGRIGFFADPDGFLWEVAYTPRFPELSE